MNAFPFVPGSEGWLSVQPLLSGWSGEEKYRIVAPSGERLLLRVSPKPDARRRRLELDWMRRAFHRDVRMPRALDCGGDETRSWLLLTWVDGEPLASALPALPDARRYELGLEGGGALRLLHRVPAPADRPDWADFFNRKIDRKIALNRACRLRYEHAEAMIDRLNELRPALAGRPQSFQHGDYHVGNMLLTPDGHVGVIDFNRLDFGDPWEEFNRIVWSRAASPAFARGLIDGYFEGDAPPSFWPLMQAYILSNELASLAWAIGFGEAEMRVMLAQAEQVWRDYEGLRRVVPAWYEPRAL